MPLAFITPWFSIGRLIVPAPLIVLSRFHSNGFVPLPSQWLVVASDRMTLPPPYNCISPSAVITGASTPPGPAAKPTVMAPTFFTEPLTTRSAAPLTAMVPLLMGSTDVPSSVNVPFVRLTVLPVPSDSDARSAGNWPAKFTVVFWPIVASP